MFGCAIDGGVAEWRAMTITLRGAGDRRRLENLVARERDAKQRDRYRAVLLAMGDDDSEGPQGDAIALRLGRSPRFVDEWAGRYRRGGIDALRPRKQPGRKPKLTAEQERRLKERLDAGPRDTDGVCALRGTDICRIIEAEFGVVHTLGGIYDVLRRIGYSSLLPRPRHRKNDPAAMERFTATDAPLLRGR
jgi:transposase